MSTDELGTAELAGPDRGLGEVRFDQPRVHIAKDLPELPPGMAGFVLRQGFALAPAGSRLPYAAAHLLLRFDDPGVRLHQPAGSAGEEATPMAVSELADGCGWLLGDPLGNTPIPLVGEVRALVVAAREATVLSGILRMDVTALATGWRPARIHGGARRPVPFTVRPPDGWDRHAVPAPEPVRPVSAKPAAVRLCVAADTESYSRFSTSEAARSQQRLVDVLTHARRHAGLREADVDLQQSGDGQFAILPAGVDESVVIPLLVAGLRSALASTNSDLSTRARLRLRVALHRGHVAPGVNGWVGGVTIAVHRLLDCAPIRHALAGAPDADFALIVSDVLFTDIIADGPGALDPAGFAPVEAAVPDKNFAERAWVYVPRR